MNKLLYFSEFIIPVIILFVISIAAFKKINAYEEFINGARDGLKTVVSILPTLIGLMIGVRVLRASGLLELIAKGLGFILWRTGLPTEIIPVIIVRMFSSSAATGLCLDIFKNYGVDSDIGFMTSILMSCTETIFYTMSVYYMAARIKKTRWTLPGAVICSLTGVIISIILTGLR